MRCVPASTVRDPTRYYGAPCLPTVSGLLWECASRDEYLEMRAGYEACESSCNTCKHLERVPQPKDASGFMIARCARFQRALRFHPSDPAHMECWESRRIREGARQ